MKDINFRSWNEKDGMEYFDFARLNDESFTFYQRAIQQSILMEDTLLQDKNGTDIYCDDILRYLIPTFSKKPSPCPKIVGEEYAYAKICKVAGGFTFFRSCWWEKSSSLPEIGDALADMQTRNWIEDNCEVIGNIHEHPEMLNI